MFYINNISHLDIRLRQYILHTTLNIFCIEMIIIILNNLVKYKLFGEYNYVVSMINIQIQEC